MSQFLFGSGFMTGIPTADAQGNAIANPSPAQFGVLQDISVDFEFDNKLLHGQGQFPVAVGRGKGKVSGKAKSAKVNGAMFNSLFFGGTLTNGIVAVVNDVIGKAIPTTPFTLTAGATNNATTFQIPNSGTWSRDLGVLDSNGQAMTRVASAPTTGQYTVSAGVYVFAAADVGLTVYISYEYTATSTSAKSMALVNQPMGYAPTFSANLAMPYQGKNFYLRLVQCVSKKLSFAAKNDDFTVPEMDFDAFADAAGNVAYIYTTE